jgi:hypothetical protein
MSLLNIGRGSSSYNYYVLRGVIDEAIIKEARAVAQSLPQQKGLYSRSGSNKMYVYLDRIPSLAALLPQLFEDLHIIGSNFFCSEPTDPKRDSHGEWHTGHSLYFGVGGVAMTLWIPLQDMNEETGGRLKLYNGKYISQIDDLLNCQVRHIGNSISNEHSILKFLNHELDSGCKVENMSVGDALLFDEMLPHQAEKCLIHREAIAVRLVLGDYALDKELIQRVLERYKTVPGEISYAAEYLENLLEYGEYKLPGSSERSQLDAPTETMPVESAPRRTLWTRVREKLPL